MVRVRKNAKAMANELSKRNYNLISGGTDNHLMLIDLRNKKITGKEAEEALVKADITANKNMVPFDDKSPFVTSGIRFGTAAITTRGIDNSEIIKIVDLIDEVIENYNDDFILKQVKTKVNSLMSGKKLFNF
jgi:glycine hydroxymethyltransferase